MPIDGGLRRAGSRVASGAQARQRARPLRRWAAALLLLLPALALAADPQIAELNDDPDPVVAGGLYRYMVRVDNNAPDAANNTRLRFAVDSGASFVAAEPANQNCVATSATQIDCNLGTLGGNGTDPRTLVLTWRATVAGRATVEATASVSADPAANPANADNPDNNHQRQTTTVNSGANLSLVMGSVPANVLAGANVTYTLVTRNAGPNVSDAVVLSVNLSPSAEYVAAGGQGWACDPSAGRTRVCRHAGPHPVGQALPQLNIEARVTASSGNITSSASVLPDPTGGTPDPELSDNAATVDTVVLAGADVQVRGLTVLSGDPAVAGSTVRFLISPFNGGPSTASGVVVTDTLPAGWTLLSASSPAWQCGVAGLTATCTRASYPVAASDDITLVATAPDTAAVGPTGITYTHSAQINSVTADTDPNNNQRELSIRVLPAGADLSLAKTKSPTPVALGGQLMSRLVLSNQGPLPATGPLRVVDQLAAGESYVGFSGSGWSCAAVVATVTCDHPNSAGLAVGASLPELLITSRAEQAGVLGNNACTGASLPAGAVGTSARPPVAGDPNAANDCAGASALSTAVRPDLAIRKTTSTPSGTDKLLSASEDAVTYTLVVDNVSATAEAATGIVITDNLPAFLANRSAVRQPVLASVSAGSARFACGVSGAQVVCTQTGGVLLPGQSVTVPITVERPLAEGRFTNTAQVRNAAEGDPNGANNSASDTVTIAGIADVAMTGKTVTPAAVRAGETTTYVLSLRNNGPSVATGVVVSDGFDFAAGEAGLTVIALNSSAAGSRCDIAAGAVLKPGSNSFSCDIGSLADGQAESITLVVRPNWQAGNPARSVPNTATIRTSTVENPSGGDNGNNRRVATLAILPAELDLLVNTTDLVDPVPYTAGSTFMDYRVRVTSNGPSFGTGVQFSELMTPQRQRQVRFVCDTISLGSSTCNSPALCSVAGVTSAAGVAIPGFTCRVPAGDSSTGPNVGELASGQSKDVFLRFQVLDQPSGQGDVYDTVASASANEPDSFLANNKEGERTTTRQRIDLRVSKSASLPTVSLRQPFNWVIRVENRGPGHSLQTDLSDTLPTGTELTGPITFSRTLPAGSGNCTATGLVVSCSLGQLDGGGVATVTVPVRALSYPANGRLVNRATVDNDPAKTGAIDIPGGNNSGEAEVAVTRASIAGLVFEDRDRSAGNGGVPQDAASEPRIAGVVLRLSGADAYGNPVDLGASTDANGAYRFTDLSPASAAGYTLTQTQPAGHLNGPVAVPASGPDAPSVGGSYAAGGTAGNSVYGAIVLPADTAAERYNFPELRLPGLSGFVYIDGNANGRRDSASDAPIAGATVRLLDFSTGALLASASTDAAGAYQFSALDAARRYTLEQPLPGAPAGLVNGPVNPGLVGGLACASGCTAQPDSPAAGTDRIANIDLSSGSDGSQFNFGERQSAAISGTVYSDRNRDGVMDATPADGRLPGVLISLYPGSSCSGTPQATARTDADGNYSFSGLNAGANYTVCEAQPAGYGDGGVNPGASASSAAPNSISITGLPLTGSEANRFGELIGSLAGAVYADSTPATPGNTDNGVRDAGERGIIGVTITLTGRDTSGLAVNRNANTDADGNYRVDDLLQSDASGYTVREGPIPASSGTFSDGREAVGSVGGTVSANDEISAVVLPPGARATGYNFGELPVAGISGTVYIDRNRDGAIDGTPDDGRLPGVTLTLYPASSCSGTPVASTTTDASGGYRFVKLVAGASYTVCQTQPAGYGDGTVNPGAGGSSSAPNRITIPSLPDGGTTENNFGELVGALAGAVYADITPAAPGNTDNGVRDAGERGIIGVTITVIGRDISGLAVNRSATTDADGNYLVNDLVQSDASGYTLREGAIPASSGSFNDGREAVGSVGGNAGVNDEISAVLLPPGTRASGYNFGELPVSTITGTVFIDRNRDGSMDAAPTDARLPGVVVSLYPGNHCTGTPVASTTTDTAGNFSFAGVSAGLSYTVCETQPNGFGDGNVNPGPDGVSSGPNRITLSNLPQTGAAGLQFGERLASLAGAVYIDSSLANPAATNNGVRDSGEAGIAGVSITLSGRDSSGAAVNRSASTDGNGNYRFDDLLQSDASGYTLREGAIPAAAGPLADGRDTAGSAGGSTATNDQISAIVLGAGVQAGGYNFGELPLPPVAPLAEIGGSVFIDRNRDGTMDPTPTDGRLPGVVLTLYAGTRCTGTPLATATTDANGNFSFASLPAGATYTVCETQPVGVGDGGVGPGVNGSSSATNAITITSLPATGSGGHLFGERLGSLAGSVYLDANHDGQRQAAEAGIAGVGVTLSGSDATGSAVNRSTATDASGRYRFDDLPAAGGAGYSVTEQLAQPVVGGVTTLDGRSTAGTVAAATLGSANAPTSLPSRISAVLLPAGADGLAYNFGEILPSSLSGLVFVDADGDGRQNGATETGIPGVTIVLTGTDDTGAPVSVSVVTGPDGRYTVPELRPGSYQLTEPTQPPGTSEGRTSVGSAGGSVTPPGAAGTVVPSGVTGIVVGSPGTLAVGYHFAELPASAALGGQVWLDANNDGTVDSAEAGLAGVTVTLSGTDLLGRAVSLSTRTDASGAYRFEQLAPGRYTLTQPSQPSGTLNGQTRAGSAGGTASTPASTPSVIGDITLAAGQVASANNFGEIAAASVSGQVFVDHNGNGSPDTGETGLPGITLVLSGTDDLGQPVSTSAATGPDGGYSFPNLRPGTYSVTEPTQPAGTVNGATTPGPLGGSATPVGSTPSVISGIVLPTGGQATGNHFAEQGQSPDLRVAESHSPATLNVGGSASYPIGVRNAGDVATSGSYTVDGRLPVGLSLSGTPTGNGWVCSGAAGASSFNCSSSTVLVPGAVHPGQIAVTVAVGAAALPGSPVSAWVLVEGGGESDARRPSADERSHFNSNPSALPVCLPAIVHNACREPAPVQAPAAVAGTVWFDRGSNTRLLDAGDTRLPGWGVEVLDVATGQVIARATTAVDGSYRVDGLQPGVALAVRFRDPASGVVFGYPVNGETAVGASGASCVGGTPPAGTPSSCAVAGATPQLLVVLAAGQLLPQQSLPVDPSGVVYDALQRSPVSGAQVALAPVGNCVGWDPASAVVGATLGGYAVRGASIAMTVGGNGFYQFQLAPAAPASCTFGLTVTPPAGYLSPSLLIPANAGPLLPPGAAGSVYAVQPQADAPSGAVGTATTYYLTFTTGSAGVSVVHNHIPLDPALPSSVSLSKTGDKARAEVGDSVRYTVSLALGAGSRPVQTTVVDRLPAGFTYIAGTALVNGVVIADPSGGVGPTLAFNLGPAPASGALVLQYRVRVGVGAQQGDGINRAQAYSCSAVAGCVGAGFMPVGGALASNEGRFQVAVGGGVFGEQACVLGKVFVDCNHNHVQDREELGIPGVRLVMSDGSTLISDSEGKYSVCGVSPRSHVLRIDPLTLPRGARLTTSSNRNLGDAGSLWLDLKNGELHRADFIEGSCSNSVLEQTKARRAQGEVRAPETERRDGPALRFDSKAHGLNTLSSPQQGTDGANQQAPKARLPADQTPAPAPSNRAPARTQDAQNVPTPDLPMNRPPPTGRDAGMAPDAAAQGGSHGTR